MKPDDLIQVKIFSLDRNYRAVCVKSNKNKCIKKREIKFYVVLFHFYVTLQGGKLHSLHKKTIRFTTFLFDLFFTFV